MMVNNKANAFKIIGIAITIILSFTGYLVATDLNSRTRDDCIEQSLNAHILTATKSFNQYAREQQTVSTEIMIALKGITKDIQYMKDK